ncbi:MAG: tyrosine-type recombinase/integrase [Bacilli bacterium]|nr:tyrosine-type recombinase/integrase [Bacilli bacterium]MBQ7240781.1 tyrosine-type recombinase/integrase [Bacilli bacterium]
MNNYVNQNKWIKKVEENLKLRGRSEKTFINYKSALVRFFNYYSEETNIKKLKEEDIINFLNNEYIKPNRSKYTYNVAIAAIRLLYLVCFNITLNKVLLPSSKLTKRIPAFLPREKFIKIINEETNLKHKCWLILSFCSGLRVDEVSRVKVEDINSKEHKLKVLGKGNKERYTILPDVTIRLLRLYCLQNNIRSGYLFPGINNKEVINSKTIINYFSVIKYNYHLDYNISFHSLRHAFATYYLANGGSLLALQSMLGHTNLNTTTIYLHLAQNFNELAGIKYV